MALRTTHPRFDLIISDNDGCLVAEDTSPMDLESLGKLAEHNRLAQSAHDRPVLTLCSGRPQPFAEAMCRLLANRSAPCIAENGVWMYHPADNRYEIDPAIAPAHRAAVREASDWVASEYGPRGVSQQPGKAASISLYHPDTDYLKSIRPRITDEFARRGWPLRVSMTWFYINCDLAHVSKGTGLDRLLAATGLSRGRLMGIGDTTGDMPIRERTSFFACPANAQEEIKAVADYVSPFPMAKGVVDIIQRACH
jgi:hydroxymethylpyrimidine pyrophosphatase-like HAD family hydrolase